MANFIDGQNDRKNKISKRFFSALYPINSLSFPLNSKPSKVLGFFLTFTNILLRPD